MNQSKNLIFIGMMGAGKTTIGRECARLTLMDFCDTDEIFCKRFGSIAETFAKMGEQFFRSEESKILKSLSVCQNTIIACGGGAVLSQDFAPLRASGTTVYLKADPQTLHDRLKNDTTRPLYQGKDSLKSIYEQRAELYEELADHTIDTTNASPKELAKQIVMLLGF